MKLTPSQRAFKLVLSTVAALGVLLMTPQSARADSGRMLEMEIKNCIATTDPFTFARAQCLARAVALWAEQKVKINININFSPLGSVPTIQADPSGVVTVSFETFSSDPLERIDLFLVNDSFIQDPPEFGLGRLVGSSTGGPISFSTSLGGDVPFDGALVAIAHFEGHDLDTDGDYAVAYTTTVPEPATIVLLGTGLAGVAIKTRKRLKNRKSG